MKSRLLAGTILIVLLAFMFALCLTGCGPIQEAGKALLLPPENTADTAMVTELQADRVEFQKVIDNPDASKADKAIAAKAVPVLDKTIAVAQQDTSGSGMGLLFEILAALGVPGALTAGVMAFVGGVSVMGLTWRSARTFQSINDRLKAMETFFEECSKRDDCPVKKRFRK